MPLQQTFEPGGEVGRGRDLDLVLRRAEHGAPREERIHQLGIGREVGDHRRAGGRVPVHDDRAHRRREALVALGVERRDAPVVGAVGDRRRRACKLVPSTTVGVAARRDDRGQQRVGRDRDGVLRCAWHRRPAQHERVARVGGGRRERRAVRRAREVRDGRPLQHDRAASSSRPTSRPGRGHAADAPAVGAVDQRARERDGGVLRRLLAARSPTVELKPLSAASWNS